jgi:methionine synthase II (cobalamin-independent)
MTFLATHVGSLPRPQSVVDFLFARERGVTPADDPDRGLEHRSRVSK